MTCSVQEPNRRAANASRYDTLILARKLGEFAQTSGSNHLDENFSLLGLFNRNLLDDCLGIFAWLLNYGASLRFGDCNCHNIEKLYKVMMGLIFESVITSGYAAAGGIRLDKSHKTLPAFLGFGSGANRIYQRAQPCCPISSANPLEISGTFTRQPVRDAVIPPLPLMNASHEASPVTPMRKKK
jgi:hypothetical protein